MTAEGSDGTVDLYRDLLQPAVLGQVHARIIAEHTHFFHETSAANFRGIRRWGLLPRRMSFDVPASVTALGYRRPSRILCLRPRGTPRVPGSTLGPQMRVAVAARSLPASICLDWSWPESWNIAGVVRGDGANEVASILRGIGYGSVIVYERIPADRIVVMCEGNDPGEPADWPPILDVDQDQIQQFQNDV